MPVIDADTHVDETDDTWEYMQPAEQELKPYTARPANPDPKRPPAAYWMVDGQRQIRRLRDDKATGTTIATRELLDVPARLRDMDRMGMDIQVMYPTLFLTEATERPEVELALRRAYNRWLGDRFNKSNGRLRWVCLPPTMSMDEAIEELQVCKENGACGVLKKGDAEAGRWPSDEYFFPLYEEAQRLDMPICFHLGSGIPAFPSAREGVLSGFLRITMPPVHAFQSLLSQRIPEKFPTLRFGFIEVGLSWLPFVLHHLRRTAESRGAGRSDLQLPKDVLSRNRMYITCAIDEDLPYLLNFADEDNLMMGSDYTHEDQAQELEWPRLLQARADRGEIPQRLVQKITFDNPRTFYGL